MSKSMSENESEAMEACVQIIVFAIIVGLVGAAFRCCWRFFATPYGWPEIPYLVACSAMVLAFCAAKSLILIGEAWWGRRS